MTAPRPPARPPFQAARLGRHPALRALSLVVGGTLVVVLVALSALAFAAALVITEEAVDRAFEDPVRHVVVRVHGAVEVSPAPGGGARVERTSTFSFRRPTVTQSLVDGVLDVRVHCQGMAVICDNRIRLTVPAEADVDIRAQTVHVADLAGSVRVAPGAGPVVLERLSGPVDVDLGAGPVRGRGLASDEVRVRNGAGPVDLDFARAPTLVDAETGAGPVQVVVPPGDPYRVDARTGAGPTRVDVATDPDGTRVLRAHSGAGPVDVRYHPT